MVTSDGKHLRLVAARGGIVRRGLGYHRAATIRVALIETATYTVLDAPILWAGQLDTMQLTEDAASSSVRVSAESAAVDLLRAHGLQVTAQRLAVLRAIVEDYVATHEPVGSRSLTAVYGGSALYTGSTSAVHAHTVNPAATSRNSSQRS